MGRALGPKELYVDGIKVIAGSYDGITHDITIIASLASIMIITHQVPHLSAGERRPGVRTRHGGAREKEREEVAASGCRDDGASRESQAMKHASAHFQG